MLTFQEIGLSRPLLRAVTEMGFEETTLIQEQTIPIAIEGQDVIGQAQTGTGKTAAFGIPIIEKAEKKTKKIQSLILAPTRELAIQVAEELSKIGKYKGIKVLPIYGGQSINHQIKALKNRPNIIVGTPGRLLDHIRRKTINLQDITTVVLDEADEMLNMGFIEDIETILSLVPSERQTLLFSATMPKKIQELAQKFMQNPVCISIKKKGIVIPEIKQSYLVVNHEKKLDTLCRLIDLENPELTIVFCRTKRRVDELDEALKIRGYSSKGLHGGLTQANRNRVLRHFREGTVQILVATDIAARGLDISNVTHVFNYDIPQDPESYVHRIGRTGRAGKSGFAITLVTSREIKQLKFIEKIIKTKINRHSIPNLFKVREGKTDLLSQKILGVIEKEDISLYRQQAKELLENMDSVSLLSAALKLLSEKEMPINKKIGREKRKII